VRLGCFQGSWAQEPGNGSGRKSAVARPRSKTAVHPNSFACGNESAPPGSGASQRNEVSRRFNCRDNSASSITLRLSIACGVRQM
jgi:hypothetical protein